MIARRADSAVHASPAAFVLPTLPFAANALEPHVSAASAEYHHGRHHADYVGSLNEMMAGSALAGRTLESVMLHADGRIRDMAAEHWNHSFFWRCLSPTGGGAPRSLIGPAIASTWGSVPEFKARFDQAARGLVGSGWIWLVRDRGALSIRMTKDATNPLSDGARPLLALDLWEHAYYIDHGADRDGYLRAFWEVVNWDFASRNLEESFVMPTEA